jgi:hypothetical protein
MYSTASLKVLRLAWRTPADPATARAGAQAMLEALGRLGEPMDLSFRIGTTDGRIEAGFVIGAFDNDSTRHATTLVARLCDATMPWFGFEETEPDNVPSLMLPTTPETATRLHEQHHEATEDSPEIRAYNWSPVGRVLRDFDGVISATLTAAVTSTADQDHIAATATADLIVVARNGSSSITAALLAADLLNHDSALHLENACNDEAVRLAASHGLPHPSPPNFNTLADVISLPDRLSRGATDAQLGWKLLPVRPTPTDALLPALESRADLHRLLIGRTGMGKSTLLLHLFAQAVERDVAVILIDIHGDLTRPAIDIVNRARPDDLVTVDLGASTPDGFNPMLTDPGQDPKQVLRALKQIIRSAWEDCPSDFFGPVFWGTADFACELVSRASRTPTLEAVTRVLQGDVDLVEDLLQPGSNRSEVWPDDPEAFERLRHRWDREIQSFVTSRSDHNNIWLTGKLAPFTEDDHLRKIFCAEANKVVLNQLIQNSQICVIHAPLGQLGRVGVATIGATVMHRVNTAMFAAYSGHDPNHRLALFLDEWTTVAHRPVEDALAQGRKTGLELTLACQSFAQMREPAITLGTIGTLVAFRVGPREAPTVAAELGSVNADQLRTLPPHMAVVRTPEGDEHVTFTPSPDLLLARHTTPAKDDFALTSGLHDS